MEQMEKAIQEGRKLSLYEDSEMADQQVSEDVFDALWQSLYDVYQLACFGVIPDVTREELEPTYHWLVSNQSLTKAYQDISIITMPDR